MYEVLYQGLMTVGVGDLQLELPGAMSKGEVSQAMASILNSANSFNQERVSDLFACLSAAKNPAEFFSAIAEAWSGFGKWFSNPAMMGVITATINLVATLGMFIANLFSSARDWFNTNVGKWLKVGLAGLTVITSLMRTISQIARTMKEVTKPRPGGATDIGKLVSGWVKMSVQVGLVFTIIASIIVIVTFIVAVVEAGVGAFSLEFDDALAATLAE